MGNFCSPQEVHLKIVSSTAPSHPAGSGAFKFLCLPEQVRDRIYRLLLVVPHPLFLFQGFGSQVEVFAPDRPALWLSLVYINRQIAREACVTLYGMNRFHLEDTTEERQFHLAELFLNQIGHANAASLSKLSINFPPIQATENEPRRSILESYSLRTLQLFKTKCASISTLELVVYNKKTFQMFTRDEETIQEALTNLNDELKAMRSLQSIIIRINYSGQPTVSTKDFMQRLGWDVFVGDNLVGSRCERIRIS